MAYFLTVLKVDDYERWKTEFDCEEGKAFRKSNGMKSYQLFRTRNDPNTLALLCEFDSFDFAQKFSHSDDLKEISMQSGVIEESGSWIIEEIEKISV